MKADARLTAERDGSGRTVLRELRSMAPLTLFPKRDNNSAATVHLVNSATSPLGGDELALTVLVGPGARLRLSGVAATLALPGHRGGASRSVVRIEVGAGGVCEYLPEPTVVTARADHYAELHASLGADARLRLREMLVLGRSGERPGLLRTSQHVLREGVPLLRQVLRIGDPELAASAAYLAGRRVLGTELLVWGPDPAEPTGGDWWSLTPLAAGGSLATALAHDAVTASADLASALATHPGWSSP
ncbi:urease accessory protein UreD [Amycolatopsis nigrescens]|uniref:urease accessory protein UreD n=1 Tax=Amycolatopsis nigrescens TaxID=381445 RepID=UPI000381F9BE|nr:urease accessory protein UreD [Amycolatopsis nigrescens]